MNDDQIKTTQLPHVDLLEKIKFNSVINNKQRELDAYLARVEESMMRENLDDLLSLID